MKTLLLKKDFKKEVANLVSQFVAPSHASLILDADTTVVRPDGSIAAVLICKVIPQELCELGYELWKKVNDRIGNRPAAVGTASLARSINKDGKPSGRSGVSWHVQRLLDKRDVRQGILGYLDAARNPPCRKTPLTKRHPKMLSRNKELIELVDRLYSEHLPNHYAIQRAEVEKVPRWRLWDTAFTTIYIAKNLRSCYHTDSGNLRGVMSALMPMRKFTGGELVIPRWRIAIAYKPGDLLLFDPQQLHGNLPFKGKRLSAAYYCERRIADCGG